jgi:hypothetical protein
MTRDDAPETPLTDDPNRPADGLDPGDAARVPSAARHHGAIDDPAHPAFEAVEHRALPQPTDLAGSPERSLVVDDHASQTAGPGAATQAELGGRAPVPGSTDPGDPHDPRRDRPDAEPAST